VIGLLILLGTLPLAAGYIHQGDMAPQLALISTALLVALAVMRLNLLRRAMF
jgi:hypothetical protein